MPRLESFSIKIKTGDAGLQDTPKYSINGFPLEFDEATGSVEAGETFEGKGFPQSFPHTLLLSGPTDGTWDIQGIEATYQCAHFEPYTVRLGAIQLHDNADLNLWYEPPPKALDV